MSIDAMVQVNCDGGNDADATASCEGRFDDVFASKSEARRYLRALGWTFGRRVLCPTCARRTLGFGALLGALRESR